MDKDSSDAVAAEFFAKVQGIAMKNACSSHSCAESEGDD